MNHKIDETNLEILRILQEDSSVSHKQIAGKINKSITTVSSRIKWLIENQYISSCRAMLNRKKLNLDINGCLYLKLAHSNEDTICNIRKFLTDKKGISQCHGITGSFNLKMEIVTKNVDEFTKLVNSVVVLSTVKEYYSYMYTDELIAYRGFSI